MRRWLRENIIRAQGDAGGSRTKVIELWKSEVSGLPGKCKVFLLASQGSIFLDQYQRPF
jgi:hypothetical protein